MDRATSRTDPLTHAETYAYDSNGNPTTFTDRKNQVTSTTYDALDRPTLVTYQDSSTTAYTWDAGHRLTQLVDSISGTITRTYDDLDRLTQEVTPQGTISYTYDAAGRRTSMTVQGQTQVTYTYDNADRLTQIAQGSATVTLAYDNADRRTSLTLPNGVVTEYAYDVASRLTGLTYKLSGTPIGTLTYSYDAAGNRTGVGGTWARTGLPAALTSATYNAANQQTAFGGTTQTFDLNGNLTSDGTNTYTWDARNRLASLSGGATASFQYDPLGRRTSKTINSTQTGFLYDGLNPVQELNGSTPTANLLTGLGIDEYLTRTGTATSTYLTEALGSTVTLTDSSGTVQASYTYEPFGATSTTGTPGGNNFDYTGRENDGTGLKYYRARYYHPSLQRFVSEDPLGLGAGDANLYAYTFNTPLNETDPDGMLVAEGLQWPEECKKPSLAGRKPDGLAAWLSGLGGEVLWTLRCDPTISLIPMGVVVRGSGVATKAVNLPAWRRVAIDMSHVAEHHMPGGRFTEGRTLFPSHMTQADVAKAIRQAYKFGEHLKGQGESVLVRGQAGNLTIEMWVNRATRTVETAYPVF